jgi:N-carbamoylputrescine amidase
LKTIVSAIQLKVNGWNRMDNVAHAQAHVRAAAKEGAQIILLPELFELPYFCTEQDSAHFKLALPLADHPTIASFSRLAAELQVVLPISVFERAGQAFFNTVVIIDADGSVMGHYRKTHIPDYPGYNEKFYFTPGDTGFKVWATRYAKIGVGICWDQWFPEMARAMALMGAQVLMYPTAIGSDYRDATFDSSEHWTRTMQGHAAANMIPLLAANRTGTEQGRDFAQTYHGMSFIAGGTGELLQQANRTEEVQLVAELDFDMLANKRAGYGLFRDRRPETYGVLRTSDGLV